jgi:hypothetical protein
LDTLGVFFLGRSSTSTQKDDAAVRERGDEGVSGDELEVGDDEKSVVGDDDEELEGDDDVERPTDVGDDTAAIEGSHHDAILA